MEQFYNETIEVCVLRALIYADIFDFPLTAEELRKKLIVGANQGVRPGRTPGFVLTKVMGTLAQLVDDGRIESQGRYYFLPGREKIVESRRKREKYCRQKLEIAKKTAAIIKCLPLVKFIGVTGSVAAGNAKKEDDIDLLIIASTGWLWTTRLLVTIIVGVTGIRRRPGEKKVKNKICLNMFVDESNLNAFSQNLFVAHELIQLKPLIDKDNTYHRFLDANQWVKEYLPNSMVSGRSELTVAGRGFFALVRKTIESMMRKFQLWWMRRRRTTETVHPGLIAFHPEDISQEIMVKYHSRIRKL